MTSRPRAHDDRPQGIPDELILGLLSAGVVASLLAWLTFNLQGLMEGGGWPALSVNQSLGRATALWRNPASAGSTPWLLLLAETVVFGVAGWLLGRSWHRRRGQPGWASRSDLRKQLSLAAVRKKAHLIRPQLDARHAAPFELGLRLGRDESSRLVLYGSLEDSFTVVGPPRSGKGLQFVIPWTLNAPGAVVVPSTKPDTLAATIHRRSLLGPVHVFDPQGLSNWPSPLRWALERGCEDPLVAILRARALAAGAKVGVGVESGDFWSGMTQAVLRCYLHAAALDDRDISHVLRWTGAPTDPEPIRVLLRSSAAAPGWADELEEQASADARQRGSVWAGVRRALDSLADPRVLASCTPASGEGLNPDDFLRSRSTLYLLGSSGAQLSVAPLITALIEDITERGRQLASESPMGRLDPPLLLLLDEVANIAPLPSLPSLLADGGGVGLPTVAVLQSLAQARSRWGIADAEAMWDASTIKIVLGGLGQADDLSQLSRILGERPRRPLAGVNDVGRPVTAIDELRTMPFGRALLLHRASLPVRLSL